MTPAARVQAAIEVLDRVLAGTAAEAALTTWARGARYAGSKDRAAVRDHVFDALRQRSTAATLGGGLTGRGLMLGLARAAGADPATLFTGERHAPAALAPEEAAPPATDPDPVADFPAWLHPELVRSLGPELASVARLFQTRADVFLRVNIARVSREAAIAALAAEGIPAEPHPLAATALRLAGPAGGLRQSRAFADGLVELQDAASQAVIEDLGALAGLTILDYCAGGGGKALALAALGAQVTAHDADPARMRDLAPRAARAGAAIRILDAPPPRGETFDLVLCDAPCSGSGAWRRSPDARWRLTPERLEALAALQLEILEEAAPRVAPGGRLAYATCSLLARENEDVLARFLERNPGWRCAFSRRIGPLEGGDGFFAAHLTRRGPAD